MLTITVNRKNIIKEFYEGSFLIGIVEKKQDCQRELDLRSKEYKVVINET